MLGIGSFSSYSNIFELNEWAKQCAHHGYDYAKWRKYVLRAIPFHSKQYKIDAYQRNVLRIQMFMYVLKAFISQKLQAFISMHTFTV